MHSHTITSIHTLPYIYAYKSIHTYIPLCLHIHTHTPYIHTHTYVPPYIHSIHTYTYMHTSIHLHTCTFIHSHPYINFPVCAQVMQSEHAAAIRLNTHFVVQVNGTATALQVLAALRLVPVDCGVQLCALYDMLLLHSCCAASSQTCDRRPIRCAYLCPAACLPPGNDSSQIGLHRGGPQQRHRAAGIEALLVEID